MSERVCKHCKFYEPDDVYSGICRRHAPHPVSVVMFRTYKAICLTTWWVIKNGEGDADKQLEAFSLVPGGTLDDEHATWPMVEAVDWCGEFAERPA